MKTMVLHSYGRFILPALILASSLFLLRNYFFPQLQIVLGLLVAPFVFRIKEPSAFSARYFYAALVFFAAYYALSMKLMLFLGLGAFLLYSIESAFGKIGLLPFIFLICISPAMHYVVTIFTFSLRLALSHYAADLLNGMGYAVQCHGNYFTLADGFTFNVDRACLGLNMFNTGLALTALLVGLTEKKTERSLPFTQLCLVFISAAGLLILANFLRILVIVLFRSLPGTPSHELIGMFSMILYMAAPVHFLVAGLVKRFGRQAAKATIPGLINRRKQLVFPAIAFAALFFSFKTVERSSGTAVQDLKLEQLQLPGFSRLKKEDGVMEYRRDSLLVYIKPAVKAFESDHPPALCWKGSGFEVEQISEVMIGTTKVLMALIKKGSARQYTAWWYDNGTLKTTDQWTWRLAKGEPFRIVNLTAPDRQELITACSEFLAKKLF